MSLLSLPLELYLRVANNLESEKDLNALAQASRQLYLLLNPALYRNNIRHHRGHGILKAAGHGQQGAVERFITEGYDVRAKPVLSEDDLWKMMWTRKPSRWAHPIMVASRQGHADLVRYLLQQGSDPRFEVEEWGPRVPDDIWDPSFGEQKRKTRSTIELAAENGSLQIVTLLFNEGGYDYSVAEDFARLRKATITAAYHGNRDVVEYFLLGFQRHCEQDDPRYYPIVHETLLGGAYKGHIEVVSLLLQHGADINYQVNRWDRRGGRDFWDAKDKTALMTAAEGAKPAMVQFLLDNGANVDLRKTYHGEASVFDYAVQQRNESVAKVLFQHYGTRSSPVILWEWLFRKALKHGCANMIQLLLDNWELSRVSDDNPLELARREHEMIGIPPLLMEGFNEQDLLRAAVAFGRDDVVKLLLQRGADPNIPIPISEDPRRRHGRGHVAVLRTLVKAGARIDPTNLRDAFFDTHCCRPEEIEPFMEELSVQNLEATDDYPVELATDGVPRPKLAYGTMGIMELRNNPDLREKSYDNADTIAYFVVGMFVPCAERLTSP